jgi:hypothetical protein
MEIGSVATMDKDENTCKGRSMDMMMDFSEEVARQRQRILRSTAAVAGD